MHSSKMTQTVMPAAEASLAQPVERKGVIASMQLPWARLPQMLRAKCLTVRAASWHAETAPQDRCCKHVAAGHL